MRFEKSVPKSTTCSLINGPQRQPIEPYAKTNKVEQLSCPYLHPPGQTTSSGHILILLCRLPGYRIISIAVCTALSGPGNINKISVIKCQLQTDAAVVSGGTQWGLK